MQKKYDFNVMDLKKMVEIYTDPERLKLAKARQSAVFAHEKPDKYPILILALLTKEQELIPAPDYKEAFYNSDLMLCQQMRMYFAALNSESDIVPSIRANMGTGTLISLLGLNQEVFPDKMPWLRQHFTKEEMSRITKEDIKIRGDFELGLKHIKRYFEVLGDSVPVYCMDTQGPFDIAHLLIGDEIFLEVYDDPPYVHHVMEIAVELCIKGHEWCKNLTGEPVDKMYHGDTWYAENMGIRICEDTSAIVGPEIMDEFVVPYTTKLAKRFGGAWVHYCGRNDYLTEKICNIEYIRGINFGFIPGHEDLHIDIFEKEMERCLKTGKVYMGNWPRRKEENIKQYLKRHHYWAAQGAIIPRLLLTMLTEDSEFKTEKEILDYWYSL